MMRHLLALGAAVSLAACDVAPFVEVRNDSGGPVILHLPGDGGYARPADVPLGQGKARGFHGDAVGRHGRYSVQAGACDYEFKYPRIGGLNHVEFIEEDGSVTRTKDTFPLTMQLEPDFRLYLLSPGKLRNGIGQPDPSPAHGFPMSPASKTCR